MNRDFELKTDGHPQAALLASLAARASRNVEVADLRQLVARYWQEPIPVQDIAGTIVCMQCPSWAVYPNLNADVTFLARALGAYVDPWAGHAALVLLDGPDAALKLAMELRNLTSDIRLHVGMGTGTCHLARIRCSGQELQVLVGKVADEAAAACALTPAGTFRMSSTTFEGLSDQAASLDACMLQTEYEGEHVAAISVTPPPRKGGEQLSSFAGLGLM